MSENDLSRRMWLLDAETALSHAAAAHRQRTRLHAVDEVGLDAEGDDATQRAYAASMFDRSIEGIRQRLEAAGADERVPAGDGESEIGSFPDGAKPDRRR